MDFSFNPAKATQLAAHLLNLNGGAMDKYLFIKMLYIADREALQRWGEPLTGDGPVSMEHGPVLTNIYDLTKGTGYQFREVWARCITDADPQTNQVELIADPGRDELSVNEIRLIDSIFAKFKNFTWKQMKEYCHHFEEYDQTVGKSSRPIRFESILSAVGRTPEEVKEIAALATELKIMDLIMSSGG